jgi:hypothetical protein
MLWLIVLLVLVLVVFGFGFLLHWLFWVAAVLFIVWIIVLIFRRIRRK